MTRAPRSRFAHCWALLSGLALLAALVAGAARPALAQDASPTPDAAAHALLQKSAAAMAKVDSFHFALRTEGGTTTIMQGIELQSIEGDVVRPDKFTAKVTAKLAIVTLDLTVVGVGNRVWITDPTSRTGNFMELTSGQGAAQPVADLLNPDRLLLRAVDLIANPTIAGTEKVGGVETTRIEGTFDVSRAGVGPPAAGALDLGPKPFKLWMDGEGRVVRLELDGALTAAEQPSIARQLDLTKYGEKVTITPPATP
jgi:hypothetical protein